MGVAKNDCNLSVLFETDTLIITQRWPVSDWSGHRLQGKQHTNNSYGRRRQYAKLWREGEMTWRSDVEGPATTNQPTTFLPVSKTDCFVLRSASYIGYSPSGGLTTHVAAWPLYILAMSSRVAAV